MKYKFELGQKVECIVTGFTGIVIGRNEWLNGCKQYCVKRKIDKEGNIKEGQWIDEEQLKIKGAGISIKKRPGGGPNLDAPKC
jgi:hypothetical protein